VFSAQPAKRYVGAVHETRDSSIAPARDLIRRDLNAVRCGIVHKSRKSTSVARACWVLGLPHMRSNQWLA
jgi:hypothetical protein